MFELLSGIWVLFFLCILSIEDILERQISMKWVLILGVSGIGYLFKMGHYPVFFPGILLLLMGYCTKEQIGYGDGFLILALGTWASIEVICCMLYIAVILSFIVSICFRKKEIPFVPFLTIGYIVGALR